MTSIVELFPKCRKLAYDARQQLALIQQQQQQQPLDGNTSSNNSNGMMTITELYIVLEELNKQLDCMDELVLRETPEQRSVWKRKIQEIRNESLTIQQNGYQYEMNNKKLISYTNNRNELLRKRKGNNKDGGNNEQQLQNLTDEKSSLEQSQFMVMDIINQGQSSIYHLKEQRQRLQGVNRILSSIDDKLGITSTTMKIIERRDITDAYLVLVGMIITCIVIYVAWF